MTLSRFLTGLTLLLASASTFSEGHGPLFGLATPTLGQGQWSGDTGLMSMESDAGGRLRPRQMIGYGIDEDLQLNLSFALDSDPTGYVANTRSGAMMGQPGDNEAALLWRFHRSAPAVGRRRESTLLLSASDGANAGFGRDTGPSLHLGAVTGYASRTVYWWLGGGAQRFRGEGGFRRGDLNYLTAVFGWRPPLFRGDYPKPDWRLFVEAVAEDAAHDRFENGADPDSGGRRVLAGPSVLGLYGPWGVSAGILFPLHERPNGNQPETEYRAKLVFTYWF